MKVLHHLFQSVKTDWNYCKSKKIYIRFIFEFGYLYHSHKSHLLFILKNKQNCLIIIDEKVLSPLYDKGIKRIIFLQNSQILERKSYPFFLREKNLSFFLERKTYPTFLREKNLSYFFNLREKNLSLLLSSCYVDKESNSYSYKVLPQI